MESVTKEQSSFEHFFQTQEGMPKQVSFEFVLLRRFDLAFVGVNPNQLNKKITFGESQSNIDGFTPSGGLNPETRFFPAINYH